MASKTREKKIALVPPSSAAARSAFAGNPPDIKAQIRQRAHEIYAARGGEPGHDVEDWLQAEREVKGA